MFKFIGKENFLVDCEREREISTNQTLKSTIIVFIQGKKKKRL